MKAHLATKTSATHLGRLIRVPSNLSKSSDMSSVNWPLGWKGVVVHGGGGVAYKASHPLVQHLTQNYCSEGVYSIELPSHGQCASNQLVTSEVARTCVYNLVSPIIDSQTIVVAYSVGGMVMSSLWKSLCYVSKLNPMGVFIGCHPKVVTREYLIRSFWSVPYTYLSLRHKLLQDLHRGDEGIESGEYWKKTIVNTRNWLSNGSALQISRDGLQFLTDNEMMTHWIIGDKDSAFPEGHFRKSIGQRTTTGGLERMMKIRSTHFNYFSKNWANTQIAIDRVLRGFSSSQAELNR